MLKYRNSCSFCCNAAGKMARIDSWLPFSGVHADNLTRCNLLSGRPTGMNHKKGYFIFCFQCCCMKYPPLSALWLSWQVRLSYCKERCISGVSWNMHGGIHRRVDVHTEGQMIGARNEINASLSRGVDSRGPNLMPFTSLLDLTITFNPVGRCCSLLMLEYREQKRWPC